MGLLIRSLALPVTGPIKSVTWIAQKLVEQAERELYDERSVRGQLMTLELKYDMGQIDEETYLAAEAELLERLKIIRQRQKDLEQEEEWR